MAWKSRFTQIAEGTAPAIDRGTHRAASYILDLAEQLAPELTGELKGSGELSSEAPNGSLSYDVRFTAAHALAVEYGRPDMPNYPAQPFLGPAVKEISVVKEIRAEMRALLKRGR